MKIKLNEESWRNSYGDSVEFYMKKNINYTSNEILDLILKNNDPYKPEWLSFWIVLEQRKEKEIVIKLLKVLESYINPVEFTQRSHCLKTIFGISGINNASLSTLITGPSNDFNINYFKLGIRQIRMLIEAEKKE
jgi:hypothetical protein